MLWIGGGQGAGKTTLSWHLSRANDLPLHPIDLWTYDHQARLPATDGSELSRQRRYENRAADRQGRLWMRDAGLTVMPSYPFGCECGKSGCRATWTATPDDYVARTASQRPLIAHDTPAETTQANLRND